VRRALLVLSLCLAGCGSAAGPASNFVQIQVWNRTLDPIYLLDHDGKRVNVPACGQAFAPSFHVDQWAVWTDNGRYVARQEGGQARPSVERFFVLSPRQEPIVDVSASDPLPSLPPCEGHPTVENAPGPSAS
jgi:hypothetical protein